MRFLLVIACLLTFPAPARGQKPGISFRKDIVPILANSCVKCHSGNKPKGGLDLTTHKGLLLRAFPNSPRRLEVFRNRRKAHLAAPAATVVPDVIHVPERLLVPRDRIVVPRPQLPGRTFQRTRPARPVSPVLLSGAPL